MPSLIHSCRSRDTGHRRDVISPSCPGPSRTTPHSGGDALWWGRAAALLLRNTSTMQRKLICSRNIDRSGKSTASLFTATRAASTWLGFVCQFKHVLQCLLSHLIVPYMFLSIFENNFYHCLIIAVSFSSQADRSHGLCPPPCSLFVFFKLLLDLSHQESARGNDTQLVIYSF